MNGKYVWETAKRVCDFINAHEDIITITTFGEYRDVMRKVIKAIKEAHTVERRGRQTSMQKESRENQGHDTAGQVADCICRRRQNVEG